MTSHAVFMLTLAAMLVTVTSANLEVPSVSDHSEESSEIQDRTWLWQPKVWIEQRRRASHPDTGAGGQWPVTGGQLQKWLLDSLQTREDILLSKERQLCDLRNEVVRLQNTCDVTGSEMTSQNDSPKNNLTAGNLRVEDQQISHSREVAKLRREQTEREIRGLQADHEALTNRSLQLQSENLRIKFYSNELDQNNQLLKQRVESLKEEVKQYREANNSVLESLQQTSQQFLEQQNQLKLQLSQLQAQFLNLSETLILQGIKDDMEQCKSKIAELKMVKLGSKYYYFADKSLTKTWHEAFSFCTSHGLDLVTIESAEENDMIHTHLRYRHGTSWGTHFFLGGNDLTSEGKWVWSSTDEPLNFTAWFSGQPSGGTAHNCMLNTYSPYGKWQDYPCTNKYCFICEMRKPCN